MEVFMPPGDLEAARRLAVVWLDPPNGFECNSGSITAALLSAAPHLQFELVASGVGASYVRYRSHASRERALAVQDENPIVHHGVRVRLEREETAQRTPPAVPEFCALLRASPFPAEHFSPVGIAAAFSRCGEVIEIDPICLQGHDMSAVKVVVQLYSEAAIAAIPGDLWPRRGPWGT
jgi:hypothetical protein